jgi:hypothetical protein
LRAGRRKKNEMKKGKHSTFKHPDCKTKRPDGVAQTSQFRPRPFQHHRLIL